MFCTIKKSKIQQQRNIYFKYIIRYNNIDCKNFVKLYSNEGQAMSVCHGRLL